MSFELAMDTGMLSGVGQSLRGFYLENENRYSSLRGEGCLLNSEEERFCKLKAS